MSMKENVDYIKQELSTEESFLENTIKAEKFWKKYKNIIIGSVAVAVIAFGANATVGYMNEQKRIEANTLLNNILSNPSDNVSLEKLKQSDEKLYQIALFKTQNSSSDVEFLSQVSNYIQALEKKDQAKLDSVVQDQNFLNKDFALLNKAILQIENKDYKGAKQTIDQIPVTSSTSQLVNLVKHYLMTK